MQPLTLLMIPLLFMALGALGCLLCLLMLGPVLNPPFDTDTFMGIMFFATVSVYLLKRGIELWQEANQAD